MHFKNRQIAIEHTLKIESITSLVIKHLIGISITHPTKSLDNKSSSLSLKTKIDLLIDCKKIDVECYSACLQMMSIRNQFAHNYYCNDFSDLAKYIDGIDKFLLKYSKNKNSLKEDNLKEGFLEISKIVFSKLKIEFEKIGTDYRKYKAKTQREQKKILDSVCLKYKILGLKNKRIFKKKINDIFLDDTIIIKGDIDQNQIRVDKILEEFVKENPYLLIK